MEMIFSAKEMVSSAKFFISPAKEMIFPAKFFISSAKEMVFLAEETVFPARFPSSRAGLAAVPAKSGRSRAEEWSSKDEASAETWFPRNPKNRVYNGCGRFRIPGDDSVRYEPRTSVNGVIVQGLTKISQNKVTDNQ
jgi:hypothetical protein